MTIGGTAHILMILSSIVISVALFLVVKYSKEKIQNIIIYTLTFICVFGIFFLHGTHYFTDFDLPNLMIQMLQVCNFNFILLPLCLFKRNELARQYLFYFSMPMALSTFVTYPSDVEGSMWYSVVTLTFWSNHLLIGLIPFLMIATKKFKPRKDYVLKVSACVFGYFAIAFMGNIILNNFDFNNIVHNHSYTMGADSIMILKPMFALIPIPFVYLIPILFVLTFIFWLESKLFEKYKTIGDFGFELKKHSK